MASYWLKEHLNLTCFVKTFPTCQDVNIFVVPVNLKFLRIVRKQNSLESSPVIGDRIEDGAAERKEIYQNNLYSSMDLLYLV